MTFTTVSLAIAGLAAAAIPIIIHLLFRTRRKPVRWAAMRFLLEAFKKHRKRMRLEQLLLLALRCLALVLLGAALARPVLQAAGLTAVGASRAVFLVIDNSLAASATPSSGETAGASALATHVAQATAIVEQLEPGDVVCLLTAASPAHAILQPPTADHPGVITALNRIPQEQTPADFRSIMEQLAPLLREARDSNQHVLVYLLSEFREGSANLNDALPPALRDLGPNITLLASPATQTPQANVQVTAVQPLRSLLVSAGGAASTQVAIRLERSGGDLAGEVSRVRFDGQALPRIEPRTVSWQPGQTEASVEFPLSVPPQVHGEIGVTAWVDSDAVDADNRRHAVVDVRQNIRAILIDRRDFGMQRSVDQLTAGQWVRFALEPAEKGPIEVVEVEPAALGPPDLRVADVAVLVRPELLDDPGWSALKTYVDDGGLLIVLPSTQVNVHQWTARLTSEFALPWQFGMETTLYADGLALADRQPVSELTRLIASDLQDLARPVLAFQILPLVSASAAERVLQFADGSPMILATSAANQSPATSPEDAPAPAPSPSEIRRGLILQFTVAPQLEWTNLPSKPLMVPLFQELVRQGLSVIRQYDRYFAGDQPSLAGRAAAHHITDASGARIGLDPSGRLVQTLTHEGLYEVADAAGQSLGALAVNVHTQAARTGTHSASAVAAWLRNAGPWETFDSSDLAGALRHAQSGSPIAGILLLALLVIVLLETLLARWFSHAYRDPKGAIAGAAGSGDLARGILPSLHALQRPAGHGGAA